MSTLDLHYVHCTYLVLRHYEITRQITLTLKSPNLRSDRISVTILIHSASGIIGSYWPAMSISCRSWTKGIYTVHSNTQLILRKEGSRENDRRHPYTLVELPVSPSGHGRVVSTINLGNVVSFDLIYFMHGNISCKWHLDILSQGKMFCIKHKMGIEM